MEGQMTGIGVERRIPVPVMVALVVAISWCLAASWITTAWILALAMLVALAVPAAVGTAAPVYRVGVILLFFLLGGIVGQWLVGLLVARNMLERPDMALVVMGAVRLALVGAGLFLAGDGQFFKVRTGLVPLWLWPVALILSLAMAFWYRTVFFPRLGIFAYSWFLPVGPAWRILLAAALPALLRAALDEITFRGWIQQVLGTTYSPEAAVWLGALLFGVLYYSPALQPYGVTGVLTMTAAGLFLGWARFKTGGILFGVVFLTGLNLATFWF